MLGLHLVYRFAWMALAAVEVLSKGEVGFGLASAVLVLSFAELIPALGDRGSRPGVCSSR